MFRIAYKAIIVLLLLAFADVVYAGASIGVTGKAYDIGIVPFGKSSDNCSIQEKSLSQETLKSFIEQRIGISIVSPEWDAKTLGYLFKALCELPPTIYLTQVPEKTYALDLMSDPKIRQYLETGIPENVTQIIYGFSNDAVFTLTRQQMEKILDLLRNGWQDIQSQAIQQTGPTQFVLAENSWKSNGRKISGQYRNAYDSGKDAVLLAKDSAGEYDYIARITHELTHKVHAVKGKEMDAELFKILGVEDEREFREGKFEAKGFETAAISFLKGALEIAKRQKNITRGVLMESAIKKQLEYGKTNPNEFISVGSEFYIYGKENFLSIYAPFIDAQKAENFYNFLKDNVFEGKEY